MNGQAREENRSQHGSEGPGQGGSQHRWREKSRELRYLIVGGIISITLKCLIMNTTVVLEEVTVTTGALTCEGDDLGVTVPIQMAGNVI